MDQATIDEWQSHTPKNLPEHVKKAFWVGFYKKANPEGDQGAGDGGHGFTGTGKGNINFQTTQNEVAGTIATEPKVDKTLLDRERNPEDFSPWDYMPRGLEDEISHIKY